MTLTTVTTLTLLVSLLLAPVTLFADHGASLYKENCALCHGDHGNGGMGVPISLASFLDSVSDHYLVKTIQLGRPGRMMPAFDNLNPEQVEALVSYLRKWSKHSAPEYTRQPIRGNIEAGKVLFATHCADCHGSLGQGGNGTGVTLSRPRNLPVIAPALANSGFLASAEDEMIRHVIENGRTGTPMPSFEATLNAAEIANVVAFVRSFEDTIDTETPEPEPVAPVISVKSPYSLSETVKNLKQAITGQNMRVLGTLYSDQGLVPEGTENKQRVMINTCRFSRLNDALKVDPRFGILLPCRISVFEADDEVMVYAADPRWFRPLFNNRSLDVILEDMHATYLAIIEEATF